ncbi:MAG: MBL fold metallo-hydrolase [Bacteroidota bacterium]
MKNLLILASLLGSFFYSQSQSTVVYDIPSLSDKVSVLRAVSGGPGGGNIGVYKSSDGFILIDDQFEVNEVKILEALKSIADLPVKLIINTHYHGDHTGGNIVFGKQNIPIYAHSNVRKRLNRDTNQFGRYARLVKKYPQEALPTTTYSKHMILYDDFEEINLYFFGNGHTDGDTIIFFKNDNIIHAGDTFTVGGYPYIDIDNGGRLGGLINILNMIISLSDENTKIIPGHGDISSVSDVSKRRNILKIFYEEAEKGFQSGLSVEEVLNNIPYDLGGNKLQFIKDIYYELSIN